jgi:NAD(P)-dependent dehydrogenase (short-subunit alcohol dehydrogenase family)
MRAVVITGVSSGIGLTTAKTLLERGFRVFGSVRKQADADRVAATLGPNFTPLVFDVTDEAGIKAAAETVRAALSGQCLAGLVNNAGIAVAGPVQELPLAEYRRQFEINLFGPIAVTQAFAPLLGADGAMTGPRGRIVMMSSVAGRNGNPFMSAYCSSKHALEGLSESLRREMIAHGIEVVIIAPGAVKTPIWDKADGTDISAFSASPFYPAMQVAKSVMEHMGATGLPPAKIAEAVHAALTLPKPKVRYEITPNPMQQLAMKLLPKRMVDGVIANRLGLRKG